MFVCNARITLYLTNYHDRLVISLFNLSLALCKLCQHHVTASFMLQQHIMAHSEWTAYSATACALYETHKMMHTA